MDLPVGAITRCRRWFWADNPIEGQSGVRYPRSPSNPHQRSNTRLILSPPQSNPIQSMPLPISATNALNAFGPIWSTPQTFKNDKLCFLSVGAFFLEEWLPLVMVQTDAAAWTRPPLGLRRLRGADEKSLSGTTLPTENYLNYNTTADREISQ